MPTGYGCVWRILTRMSHFAPYSAGDFHAWQQAQSEPAASGEQSPAQLAHWAREQFIRDELARRGGLLATTYAARAISRCGQPQGPSTRDTQREARRWFGKKRVAITYASAWEMVPLDWRRLEGHARSEGSMTLASGLTAEGLLVPLAYKSWHERSLGPEESVARTYVGSVDDRESLREPLGGRTLPELERVLSALELRYPQAS